MVKIEKYQDHVTFSLHSNGTYNRNIGFELIGLCRYIEEYVDSSFPVNKVVKAVKNGYEFQLEHRYVNHLFVSYNRRRSEIIEFYEDKEPLSGLADDMVKGGGNGYKYQRLEGLDELINELSKIDLD
jgi:hypothetical protein